MELCSNCGRTVPVGDRFCGGCGTELDGLADSASAPMIGGDRAATSGGVGKFGAVAPGLDVGDSGADVLLEGTAVSPIVRSETEVRSSAQLRWVLLGVLTLGMLVIGLSQWPKGEAPPARDSDTAAEEDTADEADEDDEDGSAPTTSAPADSDGQTFGTTANADSDTEEDTTDQATEDGGVTADDEAIPTGPLLGAEVGLGVVVSNSNSQRMSLLNLDTGLVYELAARGNPIGALDGAVVVRNNQSVRLLTLDALDSEAITLPRNPAGWAEVLAMTRDRVWLLEGDPRDDGADGWPVGAYNAAGERIDEAFATPWYPMAGLDPFGSLRQTAGGGVFQKDGDGYSRRSSGSLLVAGERMVLVRECDDAMVCGQYWYDRDNWEPLDLPDISVPTQGRATLQNDDKWLYITNWMNGEVTLHEVATGRTVRAGGSFANHGEMIQAPISSDGRFLLEPVGGGIRFVDLASGEEWVHESPDLPLNAFGVFVDLDDVGFLE